MLQLLPAETLKLKDTWCAAIICQHNDPILVLDLIWEVATDSTMNAINIDIILNDQGHTALHLAVSMAW